MKVTTEQFNNLVNAMLKDLHFLEDVSKDSLFYIKTKNLIIENLKFQGFKGEVL